MFQKMLYNSQRTLTNKLERYNMSKTFTFAGTAVKNGKRHLKMSNDRIKRVARLTRRGWTNIQLEALDYPMTSAEIAVLLGFEEARKAQPLPVVATVVEPVVEPVEQEVQEDVVVEEQVTQSAVTLSFEEALAQVPTGRGYNTARRAKLARELMAAQEVVEA
jgi:hypothetical protein